MIELSEMVEKIQEETNQQAEYYSDSYRFQVNWDTEVCTPSSGKNRGKLAVFNNESGEPTAYCFGCMRPALDHVEEIIEMPRYVKYEDTISSGYIKAPTLRRRDWEKLLAMR